MLHFNFKNRNIFKRISVGILINKDFQRMERFSKNKKEFTKLKIQYNQIKQKRLMSKKNLIYYQKT